MQREAGAVSLWQHSGCSLRPAWAPALPTKRLHRQLVPRAPCQPLCTPMLGEWGGPGTRLPSHTTAGAWGPCPTMEGSQLPRGNVLPAGSLPELSYCCAELRAVQAQKPHPLGAGVSLPALAACKNNLGMPRAGAVEKHGPTRGGSELPSWQPQPARPKATALPAPHAPGAVPALRGTRSDVPGLARLQLPGAPGTVTGGQLCRGRVPVVTLPAQPRDTQTSM